MDKIDGVRTVGVRLNDGTEKTYANVESVHESSGSVTITWWSGDAIAYTVLPRRGFQCMEIMANQYWTKQWQEANKRRVGD